MRPERKRVWDRAYVLTRPDGIIGKGTPVSEREKARMIELRRSGKTVWEIADELRRAHNTVSRHTKGALK